MTFKSLKQTRYELTALNSKKTKIIKLDNNDYRIDMYGVKDQVIAFDDRPYRSARSENIELFLSQLVHRSEFDSPNVVLNYYDAATGEDIRLSMALQKPYYNKSQDMLTFLGSESGAQSTANRNLNSYKSDPWLRSKSYGLEASLYVDTSINNNKAQDEEVDLGVLDAGKINIAQLQDDSYKISIEDVDHELLIFSSAPFRKSKGVLTSEFFDDWNSFFTDSNPNIVVNYYDPIEKETNNFACEMTKPSYDSTTNTLHFEAIESKSQSNTIKDLLTGLPSNSLYSHSGTDASLFIDTLTTGNGGFLWPCWDTVGLSGIQIINNTSDYLGLAWTNAGTEAGFIDHGDNESKVASGQKTHYLTGATCKDFDVAVIVSDIFGTNPRPIGQFWAQRPDVGEAWLSDDKGSNKIYSTGQNFTYSGKSIQGDVTYPWDIVYTSGNVWNDPVSGLPIDDNVNLWKITFNDYNLG